MKHPEGLQLLRDRGFTDETIARFKLGFNSKTYYRKRTEWGLPEELNESGNPRKIWFPTGIIIPTFDGDIIKAKIRRSEWIEGDKWPKYVEISGSKKVFSVYGNTSLPCIALESELDALLIQQEAGDLVYCVAIGGNTKAIDFDTDQIIRKSGMILFLPDFDEAGATAWVKWKKQFPGIHRILTPEEKSAGDYFKAGGNIRQWIEESLKKIKRKTEVVNGN
jgi:hypothetical protein